MQGKKLDIVIKELVAQGDLWEAIKVGFAHLPKSNIMINLAQRYQTLERQNKEGVLYQEQYQVERNRISIALLSLLVEIQPYTEYKQSVARRIHVGWIILMAPFLSSSKLSGCLTTFLYGISFVVTTATPFFNYPDPLPGQEGILVNLGLLEEGKGDKKNATPATKEATIPAPEPETQKPEETVEETVPVKPEPKKVEPTPEKEVVKTEDPEAIALKRKQEEARKKKAAAEAEAARQAEEARKKAEAFPIPIRPPLILPEKEL